MWKCVKIWKLNVWQDSFIYVAWIIDDITHPCMWHDSFICMTLLIHICNVTHSHAVWHYFRGRIQMRRKIWKLNVWHDPFIYVAWIIDDMNHSCMWHDSFICVAWLIHMCDIWPIHICVTWLIHISSMNYIQDSFAVLWGGYG